ncbi:hypothetical protein [Spirillospora sp. CA-294931]|uniref:hypothetical protein n=1 Tax=Spirillospora sp. CA-294931 TaxID=3240042 RepID=UPI003D92851D
MTTDPRRAARSRTLAGCALLLPVLGLASACSQDETALRQIRPNAVVYIDGWDQDGDRGDRARVEQKPSGMWVLPESAPFRGRPGGEFTVRVTLDPKRGFVVTDLGGVKVGKDHDDCLATNETYAWLGVPQSSVQWEPEPGNDDGANDDCAVVPTD